MAVFYPPNTTPIADANGYCHPLWSAFFDAFLQSYTSSGGSPVGSTTMFEGDTAPTGWIFCDGAELSRVTYAALFGAIGTKYGAGDGSTTFNLPDRRGKFLVGSLTVGSVESGGAATALIGANNLPVVNISVMDAGHTHDFTSDDVTPVINDPEHFHANGATTQVDTVTAGPDFTATETDTAPAATGITIDPFTVTGTTDSAVTGITAALNGGEEPLDILPPYLSIAFIIKY